MLSDGVHYVTAMLTSTLNKFVADDSVKKFFVSMKVRGKGNLRMSIYSGRTRKYLAIAKYRSDSDEWTTFTHTFDFDAAGPKALFIRVDSGALDIDDIRLTAIGNEEMPDAYKHR
jgi:hypothetical protein